MSTELRLRNPGLLEDLPSGGGLQAGNFLHEKHGEKGGGCYTKVRFREFERKEGKTGF